jgi:hypothetical protein
MNRMKGMAAGFALLATSAVAQDPTSADQMKLDLEMMLATSKMKMLATGPGVMGRTVKDAPYSGQEINENTQVLGDGTRIRNENRTMVFRDSEGRVRRETGDHVTIWDPVASVNYTLNTKTMTGFKSPMNALFTRAIMAAPGGTVSAGGFGGRAMRGTLVEGPSSVSVKDGVATVTRDGKTETFPVGPDGSWQSPDGKLRGFSKTTVDGAAGHVGVREIELVEGAAIPPPDHLVMVDKIKAEAANIGVAYTPGMRLRSVSPNFKNEDLGEQVMEGVKARGNRQTSVIEAGVIGNDRPLNTVSERWTSDELQTEVMTRRSDPRTGEMTFRLVNISRGEQPAYLFQPPSGYNITERK